MPAQSTGIAFWCLQTGEFPVTNHVLQMTNLSNERNLQVSLDHLSDSKYQGAKVQSYSRSNQINALCHVGYCQQRSGTSGNFCAQMSSNIYMAGVHFCGCLYFPNRLGSRYLLELSGRVLMTFHSHSFYLFRTCSWFFLCFFLPYFFSYRNAWQQPFFVLPLSRFCALGLMLTKLSRGINRFMV